MAIVHVVISAIAARVQAITPNKVTCRNEMCVSAENNKHIFYIYNKKNLNVSVQFLKRSSCKSFFLEK